jgi:hypothetical protein
VRLELSDIVRKNTGGKIDSSKLIVDNSDAKVLIENLLKAQNAEGDGVRYGNNNNSSDLIPEKPQCPQNVTVKEGMVHNED